jgi:hypothetical protein
VPKSRRTILSGIVTPLRPEAAPEPQAAPEAQERRPSATKAATIQTVYLPPAVHDQLRELAFAERTKMHSLIMEGLDAVFRDRGMKPIAELTRKP